MSPLLAKYQELSVPITQAVESITPVSLFRVWQEMNYRFDVCLATHGAHVVCVLRQLKNFRTSSIHLCFSNVIIVK